MNFDTVPTYLQSNGLTINIIIPNFLSFICTVILPQIKIVKHYFLFVFSSFFRIIKFSLLHVMDFIPILLIPNANVITGFGGKTRMGKYLDSFQAFFLSHCSGCKNRMRVTKFISALNI